MSFVIFDASLPTPNKTICGENFVSEKIWNVQKLEKNFNLEKFWNKNFSPIEAYRKASGMDDTKGHAGLGEVRLVRVKRIQKFNSTPTGADLDKKSIHP